MARGIEGNQLAWPKPEIESQTIQIKFSPLGPSGHQLLESTRIENEPPAGRGRNQEGQVIEIIAMPRYVAFLRAINVGGHTVKMDVLRGLFESLGFSRVETFIASGNVLFETSSRATASLEGKIESSLGKALGYEVATFLRTDSEVAVIAKYKPFRDSALNYAGAYCVGFVAKPLDHEAERVVMRFKTAMDDFHVQGREVYWLCRKKQSESMFSNAAFEKRLGIRATFRGMNTVLRLAAKYPPASASSKTAR